MTNYHFSLNSVVKKHKKVNNDIKEQILPGVKHNMFFLLARLASGFEFYWHHL